MQKKNRKNNLGIYGRRIRNHDRSCINRRCENSAHGVGEDHKSSKKNPLKAKAYFSTRNENVEFIEMLLQFAPNAQLVGMGFKEYKGGYKKQ